MSSDIVLACQGLGKTFIDAEVKVEVLKRVDLCLHAGQQIAIVGASGSGKSTLLHLLGGLDRPTQGDVTIMGQNIHRLSSAAAGRLRNRALGFVYQFHHLLAEFTALENVAMPLLIGGTPPRQAMRRAEEMLCKVGLGERLKHKPGKLSGGERQRAAVARAMVSEPACILADEPTGNLDKHTAEQIYLLMLRLSAELKISFITVTHDMELAAKMDQAFLLEEGVLQPASFSRGAAI